MKITRTSRISGNTNVMYLDITQEALAAWINGALIQDVMPHLKPEEREFLMTGITPAEWDAMFA
jgi:hypothetical protein